MSPDDAQHLGDLAADVVRELPAPATPRRARPAPPVPAHEHPFVRRVLAAFPGATIVNDHTKKDQDS